MHRRHLLAAFATAATGVIAGCSGGSGETETPTATTTSTSTQTPTPTATPTPASEPTPDVPTHGLGEPLTVGEGESAIRYTFEQFFRAQALGATRSEEAKGTFLIVVLTVENPQSETTTVPSPKLKLRGDGVIRNVDLDASEAVGSDERLDLDSIASASIAPESTVQGVVVYDVPPGNDYRIEVAPTDPDAGTIHHVTVGNIGDVERLRSEY